MALENSLPVKLRIQLEKWAFAKLALAVEEEI